MVLARLQDATDEGVTIDRQSPERITERIRSYPWVSVVDVRLPKYA
jgi:cell division septal protein FtsQ